MQKHETIETSTITTSITTEGGAAEAKVPFFARKQGRPALTVRSGVHGGRESQRKAT